MNLLLFVANAPTYLIDLLGLCRPGPEDDLEPVNRKTMNIMSVATSPERPAVILGYVGNRTPPDEETAGMYKMLSPLAATGLYDVLLFTHDAAYPARVEALIQKHLDGPACRATVVVVGHSWGGDRAIGVARWVVEAFGKRNVDINLVTIDAIDRKNSDHDPVRDASGLSGKVEVFHNYYQLEDTGKGSSKLWHLIGSPINGATENTRVQGKGSHTWIDDYLAPTISAEIEGFLGGDE